MREKAEAGAAAEGLHADAAGDGIYYRKGEDQHDPSVVDDLGTCTPGDPSSGLQTLGCK